MIFSFLQYIFAFSMITSSNSFPKPLSMEEEQGYLEKYSNGDFEARNILVERNLRLVAHIVKKYSNNNSNHNKETDDLISIGTIGLIKAISTYKTGKGTKLATYAARCIENAIMFCVTHITPFLFLHEKIGTISAF